MDYIHEKHLILKYFNCPNCSNNFSKLVPYNIRQESCPNCDFKSCSEVCTLKDHHHQSKFESLRQKLISRIEPFSVSPFKSYISRTFVDIKSILEDELLTTQNEEFFIDNYNSNFIHNFENPMTRIVFIQSQKNHVDKSPPLNNKYYSKLQIFPLSAKHCIKLNNKYEFPNCFICLKDIFINDESVLLRCGHLFHKKCLFKWIQLHSVCPICKFDIIRKNEHKSSIDKVCEKEIEDYKKVRNGSVHLFEDELKKYNDCNSNINILGEYEYLSIK